MSSTNSTNYNNSQIGVHAVVGITCCLSIFGALLIICSYIIYKELRNSVRLMLVHLSIMDLGIATTHLLGIALYPANGYQNATSLYNSTSGLCIAQAFLASYSTLGSFFWTSCIAVYLYFRVVYFSSKRLNNGILWLSHLLSYLFPAILTLWLLCTNRLGRTVYSGGWCGQILINAVTGQPDVFVAVFAYDLWQYITFILACVLYISVHIHIHQEYLKSRMFVSSIKFWEAFHNVDYKFLGIPLVFIFLRVWSSIVVSVYIYFPDSLETISPSFLNVLPYLEGMGDSGQGFLNALLFVIFTKRVRQKMAAVCCCSYNNQSNTKNLLADVDSENKRIRTNSVSSAASASVV